METARVVRVVISSKEATAGAARVNQALNSIGNTAKRTAANNNELNGSFGRLNGAAGSTNSTFSALRGVLGSVGGQLGTVGSAATSAATSVGSFTSAGASIAALGLAATLGGIAVAFGAIGIAGLDEAAKVQKFKANLETMTGSAQAAEAAYSGLVQFANNTPFTLDQSVEGFTKLRALGLSTSEAIMTSYGNTAAATGKEMIQMVEAVADATTGQFERLLEFGIKASKQGDQVAFTFQGATKTVGNNAAEIEKYLIAIGQNEFGSAMARQMTGLNGAFSGLGDKIFSLMAALGDGPFGAAVSDIINTISAGINAITPLASGIMDVFGGIVSAVWDMTKGLVSAFTGGNQGASDFQTGLDALAVTFAFIGETVGVLGSVIGQTFGFIGNVTGMVTGQIREWFGQAFEYLFGASKSTGQSMSESFVGVLRAAQFVAGQLPKIFSTALNDLKNAFGQLGSAIAAALTGDFSKFKNIDLSFKASKGVMAETNKGMKATYNDQKANRDWIDSRTSKGTGGNIDYSAKGGIKTPTLGKSSGGSSGASSGASEAERKAKAQNEFWLGLEKELELSKLTTEQAALRRKEQELEKITGVKILETDRTRLSTLLEQTKASSFVQKALEAHATRMIDLETEEELLTARINGATEEQLAVQKSILDQVAEAKKAGITLSETQLETLKKQTAEYMAQSQAIQQKNRQVSMADDLVRQFSQTAQSRDAAKLRDDQLAALNTRFANATGIEKVIYAETAQGIERAYQDTASRFQTEFGDRIRTLGELFGGTFGQAISGIAGLIQGLAGARRGDFSGLGKIGAIAGVIGKQIQGGNNKLGDAFEASTTKFSESLFSKQTWQNPLTSIGKGFSEFKDLFKKGGSFATTLGSVLGKAGAGAQMGSTIAGLGNALGLGLNEKGSSIGGALGSVIAGPLGSIVGSIFGGVLGGLFKKTKWGTSVVSNGDVSTRGNAKQFRENADTAGNSISSTLSSIADQFGAEIGSYRVSIGQYKDKWRVSGSGMTGKLNKGDTVDFGKDGAEAALRYAIQDAIKDGAIAGIRASTIAIMKAGDDVEAQVAKALRFENVFKELKSMTQPAVFAVDELNIQLKSLSKLFSEAGASSEEYAQFEQFRQLKLKAIIDEQTSGFTDLLKNLNGSAGGVSQLTLLNRNLADFQKMKATLDSGGTVDQSAFVGLGQDIMGIASSLYGTNTSQFQSIRNDLIAATNGAINNVTGTIKTQAELAKDTTTAITTQTTEVTDQIKITNQLLGQIIAGTANPIAAARAISEAKAAFNGQMIKVN
jgi:hypothetical protein